MGSPKYPSASRNEAPSRVDPDTSTLQVMPCASPLCPFQWQIDGTSTATVLTPTPYQTSHGYSLDDVVQLPAGTYGGIALPWAYACCTTAGTSGSGAPGTSAGVSGLGAGVKDGSTLVWTVVTMFRGGLTYVYATGTPLVGGPSKQYLPIGTSTTPLTISDNAASEPAVQYVSGGKISIYARP